MAKVKNIRDLRDSLLEAHDGVNDGSIDLSVARELSINAGKIIRTLSVELAYHQHMDYKTPIAFLEPDKAA